MSPLVAGCGLALVAALFACSGPVDLGGQVGPPIDGPVQDEPMDGGTAVGIESVVRLDDLWYGSGLAVAENVLYLSDGDGQRSRMYHCDKHSCAESIRRREQRGMSSLQLYEGRLAGSQREDVHFSSLVSYAVPSFTDEQVVLGGLYGPRRPLFQDGFVYWGLPVEGGVYRCKLPTCASGPQRLGSGSENVTLAGGHAFWTDEYDSAIYRLDLNEGAPVQELLLGEELQVVPDEPVSERKYAFDAFTGSELDLYAAVYAASEVDVDSPRSIVRWPAAGGARTIVLEGEQHIVSLRLFGEELVWMVRMPSWRGAQLFSCAVEDCSATRRALGTVREDSRNVTADASHLYWLAPEPESDSSSTSYRELVDREVRRIPLLAGAR